MGAEDEAEEMFDKAICEAEDLKVGDLKQKLKSLRLRLQGKHEEAVNPYFWK
jgi:hypothetical protein